jgi:hypothetical protein
MWMGITYIREERRGAAKFNRYEADAFPGAALSSLSRTTWSDGSHDILNCRTIQFG